MIFDQIHLVGIHAKGLPEAEKISNEICIFRMRIPSYREGIFGKLLKMVVFFGSVYKKYRNMQVICINCHSVSMLPLAVLLKEATKGKLIYDAHELETETNGLKGIRKSLTKLVERTFIKKVDFSVFVGDAIETWYVREYNLKDTQVIYNCPRLENPLPSNYFREFFGIPSSLPIFLYQGVIAQGRGAQLLVQAFSKLENQAALVFMGYGPLADWCSLQSTKYQNIFFHQAVPPGLLLGYTVSADFGVSIIEPDSLSYEYCLPNKIFEYMMAERPILASPTIEQATLIGRLGIGVIADSLSECGIRDGALKLISEPREGYRSSLRKAKQTYNWEHEELKIKELYISKLGFSPSKPAN